MRNLALSIALLAAALPAAAQTPKVLLDAYAAEARKDDPAFAGASAERGRAFFARVQGKEWSCASCHTPNPSAGGKHAVTGKAIAPLAPAPIPSASRARTRRRSGFAAIAATCSAASAPSGKGRHPRLAHNPSLRNRPKGCQGHRVPSPRFRASVHYRRSFIYYQNFRRFLQKSYEYKKGH